MSEQDKTIKDPSGKILSLVSHKLKTPLSIINGYSEAILSQAGKEKFSPFAAKALEEINKQGLKMAELVDKLLTYNKVSRMSVKELKREAVPLKALAKECASAAIAKDDDSVAVSSAEPTAKRGTYIEIDCSESLTIQADREILKAMLEEMLDNAIKFNNKMEKLLRYRAPTTATAFLFPCGITAPVSARRMCRIFLTRFIRWMTTLPGKSTGGAWALP